MQICTSQNLMPNYLEFVEWKEKNVSVKYKLPREQTTRKHNVKPSKHLHQLQATMKLTTDWRYERDADTNHAAKTWFQTRTVVDI